jgi:hypothetical protein
MKPLVTDCSRGSSFQKEMFFPTECLVVQMIDYT